MTISPRQVALNHTMYQTGLKARLVQPTCPSDVFIEFYEQQLSKHFTASINYLLNNKFKNENVKLQTWNGRMGLYLNDEMINRIFGR